MSKWEDRKGYGLLVGFCDKSLYFELFCFGGVLVDVLFRFFVVGVFLFCRVGCCSSGWCCCGFSIVFSCCVSCSGVVGWVIGIIF